MPSTEARRRTRAVIPLRPDPRTSPLSFVQQQMWLIDQLAPGNPAYNLARGVRLRGRLDIAALEAAFNAVIRRHEILRTTFAAEGGEPFQLVHREFKIRISVTSLEQFPPEERETKARSLATAESVRPFDLSHLPLVRASVFTLGTLEHILILTVHHIAADGLSLDLLLDEVGAACRAFATGVEPQFPALPLQYGDFAHWQRRMWADDAAHTAAIGYWRRRLGGGLPVLELPADRPRPAVRSYRGANVFFRLPTDVGEGVRALAQRERCTSFMVLLAAFQLLLARYANTSDIVIGVPLGARERQELTPLIGNFLTIAGLRCDLSGEPSFLDLLRRAREATLDALSNAVPLQVVMRQLAIERVAGRDPVFQVLFEMHGTSAPRFGDLDVTPFDFDFGIAQFDMSLHVHDEPDGYPVRIEYSTDVFDRETAERMAAAFIELVRSAVAGAEQPAMKLTLVPEAERRRILTMSTGPATAISEWPVHARIAAQAARTPKRIAVRCGSTAMTYAELAARTAGIAQALRERGVGRGDRIGVCLERSCDLLVALLGILDTGAAYVPLDPAYPAPRLKFIAEDAQLSLLVSTESLADWCGLARERQLLLDADQWETSGASVPSAAASGEDPAYLIYTSGSTGVPKGVVVRHGAVANLVAAMTEAPGIAADDILLAVTTVSFDIAVLELFVPLCVGATVIIASGDEAKDGDAIRLLLERHAVTMMQATPVTWRLLLEARWKGRSPFKALVGGESLPQKLADDLLARGVELWNMYGPTETTVWSTCGRIRDRPAAITIGRPIANTVVRVLDARRRLCPTGVPGELYIGGAGLARGYWNRPELTAERFISDPEGGSGDRLYRTGDCVRLMADGRLEHLGRLDDQVKLRGFRIELHEVEANILRHPDVRDAAAAIRTDAHGDAHLAAYLVVERDDAEHTTAKVVSGLRAHLRAELPEFLVPTRYVVLDALPRTANGKLDRRALPDPAPDAPVDARAAAAPRTATEALVLEIFRDVLHRSSVGPDDNFFEIGGDSLMAARLMLRLRAASGCNVPLGLLFERQTAARLAEAVASLSLVAPPTRAVAVGGGERVEIEL
ncbi:MAG TPA: amino acid adenylation domain-containing protein [Gemmatimonadaceae bacterium]